MFERFTGGARRVLTLAQGEARLLNHNFIGTEHILLGLLHEGEGVAARALAALNVTLDGARSGVEETVGPAGTSTTESPPFTPRAKRVLELSLREALQFGHSYIGTEHILLGLVREGEGVGAQVLVKMGADLSSVRKKVIELIGVVAEGAAAAQSKGKGTAEEGKLGPLCRSCLSKLSEWTRYRTIDIPPDETEGEGCPRQATVFYCSRCGAVLSLG